MASVRACENKRKGKTVLFRSVPNTDADIAEALSGSCDSFSCDTTFILPLTKKIDSRPF
jgi:hypothetical protein